MTEQQQTDSAEPKRARLDLGGEFVAQADSPDLEAAEAAIALAAGRCSCGGGGIAHFHADRHEPAADDLVQSGVVTPGCDCRHEGMGRGWHLSWCAWKAADRAGVAFGTAEPPADPRDAEVAQLRARVAELERDLAHYEETVVGALNEKNTGLARQAAHAEAQVAAVERVAEWWHRNGPQQLVYAAKAIREVLAADGADPAAAARLVVQPDADGSGR